MTNEASVRTATSAADSDPVEWSHTPSESRLLRALVGVSLGVVAAMTLAVAVGAVAFAGGLLLSGEYAVGAAVLLALAVAAVRTAPQFVAFRAENSSRSVPLRETVRRLGWSGFAVASTFGLGIVWVGLQLGGLGFFLVVFGTIAVPMVVVSVLSSEGELDADAGTLTYCGTDVDLAALDGFRRMGLGAAGVAVYRFSYVSGATSPRTSRFVVVPVGVDEALRKAASAGVTADPGEYDPPNRAVRATLAVFGVGLFAFAGVLLTVDPTSPNPRGGVVLVYAALVSGVFGAVFLSLAARSG